MMIMRNAHKCDNKEKIRFAGSFRVEILGLSYRGGKYGLVHPSTSSTPVLDKALLVA